MSYTPTAPDVLSLCRDEDCPTCGHPETYAEVDTDSPKRGVLAHGCRACGWRRVRPPSPAERLADLLATYGRDEVDDDGSGDYALVEENVKGSSPPYWVTTHASAASAGAYHDGQEYASDWAVVELVDLRDGTQWEFYSEHGARPVGGNGSDTLTDVAALDQIAAILRKPDWSGADDMPAIAELVAATGRNVESER